MGVDPTAPVVHPVFQRLRLGWVAATGGPALDGARPLSVGSVEAVQSVGSIIDEVDRAVADRRQAEQCSSARRTARIIQ